METKHEEPQTNLLSLPSPDEMPRGYGCLVVENDLGRRFIPLPTQSGTLSYVDIIQFLSAREAREAYLSYEIVTTPNPKLVIFFQIRSNERSAHREAQRQRSILRAQELLDEPSKSQKHGLQFEVESAGVGVEILPDHPPVYSELMSQKKCSGCLLSWRRQTHSFPLRKRRSITRPEAKYGWMGQPGLPHLFLPTPPKKPLRFPWNKRSNIQVAEDPHLFVNIPFPASPPVHSKIKIPATKDNQPMFFMLNRRMPVLFCDLDFGKNSKLTVGVLHPRYFCQTNPIKVGFCFNPMHRGYKILKETDDDEKGPNQVHHTYRQNARRVDMEWKANVLSLSFGHHKYELSFLPQNTWGGHFIPFLQVQGGKLMIS